MGHYPGAFRSFADALKGLVRAQAAQFGKTFALGLVVQQVAAKNLDEIRLCDKRRERQKNKPAFRAVATPVAPARLARLPECRIAAPENTKIFRVFREPASDLDFRQGPQQRKIADARRNETLDILGEIPLKLERFAVLVVDIDAIEAEVCRAGGMLVRH